MTLQQAAVRLGLKAGHLQYHLRRLLEADLVKLTRKRDIGRNLEKYYRATAYRYSLPPKRQRPPGIDRLCVLSNAALIQEYASRMDKTRGDWAAEVNRVRLRPEDLKELCRQVEKLIIGYRRKRVHDSEAQDYKFVWICFPIAGTASACDSKRANEGPLNSAQGSVRNQKKPLLSQR